MVTISCTIQFLDIPFPLEDLNLLLPLSTFLLISGLIRFCFKVTWDATAYNRNERCVVHKKYLRYVQLKWLSAFTMALWSRSVAREGAISLLCADAWLGRLYVHGSKLPSVWQTAAKKQRSMFSILKTCGSYCLIEIDFWFHLILFLKLVFTVK